MMTNFSIKMTALSAGLVVLGAAAMYGCGGTSGTSNQGQQPGSATNLFNKYGGVQGVQKVIDDTVTLVLADCTENPYFTTVIGTPGHDSLDRLKGCLDLQLSAALGGPYTYPGPSNFRNAPPGGWPCEDMTTIHQGLGIPGPVFDQFIQDFAAAARKDGVSDADLTQIAPAFIGLKPQIVASPGTEKTYNYTPGNPPGNGCTGTPTPGATGAAATPGARMPGM